MGALKCCIFFCNRFIGTGIKVSYEQRQRSAARYFSTDMSIGQMEFLECLFPTESHSLPPHYTEVNAGLFFEIIFRSVLLSKNGMNNYFIKNIYRQSYRY
jgi:hypothetical protein